MGRQRLSHHSNEKDYSRDTTPPSSTTSRSSRPKLTIDNSYDTKFRDELNRKRQMQIIEQDGDGNCLFRSVAHQVYGDDKFHDIVREKCLAYIESQAYFFESFVHDEEIDDYIHRMKKPGEWGGDIEIQAMSELYDRPIEIYAYSIAPSRHYMKHLGSPPIRLSYHFRSHYNSVVDPVSYKQGLLDPSEVGVVEDRQLSKASREDLSDRAYQEVLEQSRRQFQRVEEKDMDKALEASLLEFEKRMAEDVAEATTQSDLEHQEKLILENVIQESEGAVAKEQELDVVRAIQASIEDYPPAIKECLSMNFPLDLCVEAYSLLQPFAQDEQELVAAMTNHILTATANYW